MKAISGFSQKFTPAKMTGYMVVKVTWDIQHTIYMILYDIISSYTPKSPAPPPPTVLNMYQNGLDSVLVSWTSPSGEHDVTGYIIYYWKEYLCGDSYHYSYYGGRKYSENAEATATTATITGLTAGVTYYISMMTTSSTLPSSLTGEWTVTIGTINIRT